MKTEDSTQNEVEMTTTGCTQPIADCLGHLWKKTQYKKSKTQHSKVVKPKMIVSEKHPITVSSAEKLKQMYQEAPIESQIQFMTYLVTP
jgi:hypothetical protein